ncbi:Platelet glycoprotein V [Pseudolycoriella hygida]|uniref:Platelet glycoprotein V n=1 Tax=Pseudolycoriella hygida TaxID=35572 RepID=A0A9Q0S2G5_9DIPT|nr:Platelet glycoprotein V [Pseudolycoriella hygida]
MLKVKLNDLITLVGVALCILQIYRVNGLNCGRVKLMREVIRNGNKTVRGEWPFIAALFEVNPVQYICGGTVISNKHVLTAAHCIEKKYTSDKLPPERLEVRLGAFNISVPQEMGSVRMNVSKIFVHPDWKPYSKSFDGDIAVLLLSESVAVSNFIQPICLPANDDIIDGTTIDVHGTVVGWGLANRTVHEDIPRKLVAEALNSSECFREDSGIIGSLSSRSFCARSRDSIPMKGDSGGGFFVASISTWVQYGVVSFIRPNSTGHSHSDMLSAYTNVKSFKEWIANVVIESDGEVGEATMKVDLPSICGYEVSLNLGYVCEVNDLIIRSAHVEISSVHGSHSEGKGNDDVRALSFSGKYLVSLPIGVGTFFKNLKHLKIGVFQSPSLRLKYMLRSSFKNMTNLVKLFVFDNDIEALDSDCLRDLPNLEMFCLLNNRITTLKEKFFFYNEKLHEISLSGNRIENLPKNIFERNYELKSLYLERNSLRAVDEAIFKTNTKLFYVNLSENKLEFLPPRLFENNLLLRTLLLRANSLAMLDHRIFSRNINLEEVDLTVNQVAALPYNLFVNNLLLQSADFSNNSIRMVDERIFETNIDLRHVNLSTNLLEIFPKNIFKNNLRLVTVLLDNNLLTTTDESTFESNEQLQTVSLSSNPLESFKMNLFEKNYMLRHLLLENISFTTLDEFSFEMSTSFELVALSSNGIKSLPKNVFKNMSSLSTLFVGKNSLKTLDEEIFQSNGYLSNLNLFSNELESLPKNLLKNNVFLSLISLDKNHLKTIDEELFAGNVYLKYVSLSSNQLEELPRNLFRNNLLLHMVNVSNNFLKEIDENIFERNMLIRIVSFSSNKLEYLPADLFKNNFLLGLAYFEKNSLKVIDSNFSYVKNLQIISFHGNPCTNMTYVTKGSYKEPLTYSLTELQSILRSHCNSTNLPI